MKPLAVITGTTHGIGRVTAVKLAAAGFEVAMLCRDLPAAQALAVTIGQQHPGGTIHALHCDLAEPETIRASSRMLREQFAPISLLINNAGMAAMRNRRLPSGLDLNFAVNHLGHFLLTQELLDRIAPNGRIVTVASCAHVKGRLDLDRVADPHERISPVASYARSKLANVLHTFALARRLTGRPITANCLHPGIVASNLLPRWLTWIKPLTGARMIDAERGAQTTLHLALSPQVATTTGVYFNDDQRPLEASPLARNVPLQEALWHRSEQWASARNW